MLVISRIISQLIEKKKTVPFGTVCTSVSLSVTPILKKQKMRCNLFQKQRINLKNMV